MEIALTILGLLTAVAGVVGAIFAYKQENNPAKRREKVQKQIDAIKAEIVALRANGDNASTARADQLRDQLPALYRELEHLSAVDLKG